MHILLAEQEVRDPLVLPASIYLKTSTQVPPTPEDSLLVQKSHLHQKWLKMGCLFASWQQYTPTKVKRENISTHALETNS